MMEKTDFVKLVHKEYLEHMRAYDKEDAERYWNSEEAQEVVKENFEIAMHEAPTSEDGEEYTYKATVHSCAYCLSLMYE